MAKISPFRQLRSLCAYIGLFGEMMLSLVYLSLGSRLACYIFVARDAYRSAKRINAERGYANLSEKVIPKRPTINLGMRGRGNMFLALNHTF